MTGRSRITASPSITRATSGSAATSRSDAHVLKFTQSGQVPDAVSARPGQNTGSNDTENFGRVAKIFVDPKANEAYIADGYGNKRVVVIDADTGKFKRYWGAYGNKPDDTNLGPYDPKAPPSSSSARPCTAPSSRTTASSTSAIVRTIASRSSSRTARS